MPFTLSTLEERPFLKNAAVKLIEQCFKYEPKFSFEIDFYPLINSKIFKNNHLLLNAQEQVVGHIGIKWHTLETTPVALMGGICLHPKLRGKGIFSSFFKEILSKCLEQADGVLLWGPASLYASFGFSAFGYFSFIDKKITFSSNEENSFRHLPLENLSQQQWEKLKQAHQKTCSQFYSLQRKEEHWQEISFIKSSLFFFKENPTFEYFFINKGMDLKNIIHEYSLEVLEKEELEIEKNSLTFFSQSFVRLLKPSLTKTQDPCCLALFKNPLTLHRPLYISGNESI